MAKREISAKAFIKDFRSGMDEADILEKYSISRERLRSILKKLLDAKALGQKEIDSWLSVSKADSQSEDSAEITEAPPEQDDRPHRLEILRNRPGTVATAHGEDISTPGQASSANVEYRLKLYGRTSNDPDAFSANLAAVLGIDVYTARDYLDRVPVTMKEGLSEQKAERLRSVLASVGALCLVEPMDAPEQQQSTPGPSRETSIADALLIRRERTDDDEGFLPSRVKPSLLALFGTVLFLCVAGAYLLIATREAREDIAINAPRQGSSSQAAQSAQTTSDEETLPALKAQITHLEGELPKLTSRLTEEKAAFDLLVKTPGVKIDEMQKKNAAIQGVQEEIALVGWQIRNLKKRVTLMEGRATPTEEEQPSPQPKE
jgi:hypothetical protein